MPKIIIYTCVLSRNVCKHAMYVNKSGNNSLERAPCVIKHKPLMGDD